jgi:hypothetical protein
VQERTGIQPDIEQELEEEIQDNIDQTDSDDEVHNLSSDEEER